MLPFRPIEITDKQQADAILREKSSYLCAHCFVDLFIWKSVYDTQICFQDDFIFIKQKQGDVTVYTVPIGTGCLCSAIELLKQDAIDRNVTFNMSAVNESQMKEIEGACPDKFNFIEKRDAEDYIYSGESMITLAGKKLHSKRNFINRFKNDYEGRWIYENILEENIHDAFAYHLSWCAQNSEGVTDEFFGETCAISLALNNFEALGLKGGLIRIDGKVMAITLGSRATEDMFIVHIEKADYTIAGAYQIINNEFAKQNFEGIKYINREEDLGKEGLRKAKLSYNPVMMGLNFTAYLK